jgi:branched-chain amino acid transport system permease protein
MTGFLALLIMTGIFSLITLGLDFIVGYTRIFSVNQALIFAVGVFSYVFTSQILGITDIFLAWLVALAASCVVSALIGVVSLRVRGDAFVVVSFGAQIIGIQAIFNWTSLSGGDSGMFGLPSPSVFGWRPVSQTDYLILVAIVTAVAYSATTVLVRSPWGRLLRATGDDEVAIAAGGFDARRLKIIAFMLGGAYAAVAGPLYATYIGTAQVGDYSLDLSISLLAMVVLGGSGRLLGGFIGAVIYQLVPYLLDFANLPATTAGYIKQGIFGLALLMTVLFLPAGITGSIAERFRLTSARRKVTAPESESAAAFASSSQVTQPGEGVVS